MNKAWLVLGISFLLSGCDIRTLLGDSFSEAKVCQSSNPDCVFQ